MKKLKSLVAQCFANYLIDVGVMVAGTLVLIAFLWYLLMLAANL